jgi:hypothetical protein
MQGPTPDLPIDNPQALEGALSYCLEANLLRTSGTAIALAPLALVPLTAQTETLSETRFQFARGAIYLLTLGQIVGDASVSKDGARPRLTLFQAHFRPLN